MNRKLILQDIHYSNAYQSFIAYVFDEDNVVPDNFVQIATLSAENPTDVVINISWEEIVHLDMTCLGNALKAALEELLIPFGREHQLYLGWVSENGEPGAYIKDFAYWDMRWYSFVNQNNPEYAEFLPLADLVKQVFEEKVLPILDAKTLSNKS